MARYRNLLTNMVADIVPHPQLKATYEVTYIIDIEGELSTSCELIDAFEFFNDFVEVR